MRWKNGPAHSHDRDSWMIRGTEYLTNFVVMAQAGSVRSRQVDSGD
jgi:hypothetical protein